MSLTVNLSWDDISTIAKNLAMEVYKNWQHPVMFIYGIPRGGIFAAQAVYAQMLAINAHVACHGTLPESKRKFKPIEVFMVHKITNSSKVLIVDDIIDSGKTMGEYKQEFNTDLFVALVDKRETGEQPWVTFPWEAQQSNESIEHNITRIIQYIGDDPKRDGLLETPSRVVRSYSEMFSGYKQDVGEIFKVFDGDKYDEMVILKDIEFYSTCEHHLLPFVGTAHIAYIPANGRIVGLSKLARVLEVYARRLQVQERLCMQVVDAIDKHLKPEGAACIITARHMCMSCRGVNKQHSAMVTSALLGAFRRAEVRAELFSLIGTG